MMSFRYFPILFAAFATTANAQSDSATCATGNDDVRVAALSSLAQMDPDQVLPVMKKILERRDACSIALRRQVIGIVSRSRYGEQTDLLLNVARADPSTELRRYAVQALSQSNTERNASALDSILFGSSDNDLRDAALRALANQTVPTARATLRRAAELSTFPVDLRVRAVNYMGYGRRGGADETPYLIGFYAKADHPDVRDAILRTIANQHTPEATNWLLGIARDKSRDIEVRRQALSAVGQSVRANESSTTGIDLKALLGLYEDFAGQLEMQDRVLDVISQRPETLATDKLLQIARTETNPELRRKAVLRVGQRRDPRVRDFLLEVLSK
ncbi:MAG: HEAT repeat domain-containing protein [bacterium]